MQSVVALLIVSPCWMWSRVRFAQREVCCCGRGAGIKTVLCCPWRHMTFASGLICIPVHCVGMLLLRLAALYFPDKITQLLGFEAFSSQLFLLKLLCILSFCGSPLYLCSFGSNLFLLSVSFFFVSFVSSASLYLRPVFLTLACRPRRIGVQ